MDWSKVIKVGLLVIVFMTIVTAASASVRRKSTSRLGFPNWVDAVNKAWDTNLDQEQQDSLNGILNSFAVYGDGDDQKLVYILATAWHESKLKPIKERRASKASQKWLWDLQERYWPSGYYGRGFVQLTWEKNYQEMGDFLGVDLVGNPDLALRPEYAADIIVYGMMNGTFTRKKLGKYINSLKTDYYNARRVVNGTDRASLIKGYAEKLDTEIQSTAKKVAG